MQDLIFNPLKVHCPRCIGLVPTSIEELRYNDELTCPKCDFKFTPDIDVDKLLSLIKLAEISKFKAPDEDVR